MNRSHVASLSRFDLLFPLSEFADRPQGRVVELTDPTESMPEPYRGLLVHERDMTSTLEAFHRERIELQQISRRRAGEVLYRQVVLIGTTTGRPLEFGAIRIDLDVFEGAAREVILGGRRPLGAVLADFAVDYSSRPRVFFSLTSDSWIEGSLGLSEPTILFGRQNVLRLDDGRVLADVVEILPPVETYPVA